MKALINCSAVPVVYVAFDTYCLATTMNSCNTKNVFYIDDELLVPDCGAADKGENGKWVPKNGERRENRRFRRRSTAFSKLFTFRKSRKPLYRSIPGGCLVQSPGALHAKVSSRGRHMYPTMKQRCQQILSTCLLLCLLLF